VARRAAQTPPQGDKITRAIKHIAILEREALKVYRPATDRQQQIHESPAKELLVRGGKRAAKTLCSCIEFASRVLGQPIIGMNDKPIPLKYPVAQPDKPLIYWIIGWDLKHIGQTVYRNLFEPGLFQCIRDNETGQWRAFNPAREDDAERESETLPSQPIIPSRMIVENSWSWDHSAGGQAEHIFRSVRLKNGAVIRTFPSSGKNAAQGQPVSGLMIDEDIQNGEFLEEWQDRLTDRGGWFMWSVWPHMTNTALLELLERAEDAEDEENPRIEAVQLLMSENPFIKQEDKDDAFARMGDEESIARRDRGELQLHSLQMYDYAEIVHGVGGCNARPAVSQPKTPRDVLDYFYHYYKRMPDDWTRYLAVDPSHTRTAVLFGVVPPPEVMNVKMGRCLVIEDELVVKRASASVLAQGVKQKIGTRRYEAFIMDRRMGQQTRVGGDGRDVFTSYADDFRKAQLTSRITHSSFIPGCDKPPARYNAVRRLLEGDAWPHLYLILDTTLNTQKEFRSYRKKQKKEGDLITILDEPANSRKHDAMAALEYLAKYFMDAHAGGIAYTPPTSYPGEGGYIYRLSQRMLKQQTQDIPGYVHLGPRSVA
jgi:hypothetical protein